MHANYCFLFRYPAEYSLEELRDEASGLLGFYIHDFCDENNWYQPEMVVTECGEVIPLVEGQDWRGRESLQQEYLLLPETERWPAVLQLAQDCVLWECSYFADGLKEASFETLRDSLRQVLTTQGATLDSWRIKKIGSALYQLDHMRQPPFTDIELTPYDTVRAINWSPYYGDDSNDDTRQAVLVVDIHT
jgi:hypothetical protein